ncbi:imelysin family protein [Fulvivirga ulvae]|uniref:imelysin family protein n=1 Tax=Fulvivirga ulvae TaxID=2904245 RepID=UPI001F2B56EE|nr:imelysin family protein [Fulvivirga ulvae]UII31772.1 imelysin family protein [Fulvivirga ulvae]
MNRYYTKMSGMLVGMVLISTLVSCGDDDEKSADNFDRTKLLENIGTNIVVASYSDFSAKTALLEVSAVTFAETPTVDNLAKVQSDWLIAAKSYKMAEMFNFGPIDQLNLMTSIDNWPTNISNISSVLETTEAIDNDFVKNLGSSTKGLPAIEYLIFDDELDNAAIVQAFVDNQNRSDFLKALTVNLAEITLQIDNEWTADKGNYVTEFINANGKDISSSANILANNLIQLVEIIKNEKVGIPLGKKSGGTIFPEDVEAPHSLQSLELILQNLTSIKQVYTGDTDSGSERSGFEEYLDGVNAQYQGEQLSVVIAQQIDACITATEAIDMPLKQALTDEPVKVDKLYTELQKLTIYVKTDMMSSLGLLVTFSDNDGD